MKNKKILLTVLSAALMAGCITGCGEDNPTPGSNPDINDNDKNAPKAPFSFDISLASGKSALEVGDTDTVVISTNGADTDGRTYSFASSKPSIATIGASDGKITTLAEGKTVIVCTEAKSGDKRNLVLVVTSKFAKANGGFNYASSSGEEAIATRTEILGKLEKYAMDNHLTGITLFENGGFVKYHERVTLPTTNYITGYGFGLLSEGSIDADLATEENVNYKRYLHAATTSDPKTINARNDTGSQVSDLEGYITSSFWGTKMNKTKDQYVWYPVLAKDKVTFKGISQDFTRPIPVFNGSEVAPDENPNPLGLYKTWRIYVKTGADGGIKFRYNGTSWGKDFDNTPVTIDDYAFAYRLLLTGAHNLKRGTEMAADQTYGIFGAQKFNTRTKNSSDEEAKNMWDTMTANGELGIKTGHDNTNGDYIQLTILNAIDRFTAMYTLSSNLLSPMSEDFIRTIGEGSIKDGAQRYGTFNMNAEVNANHRNKIVDFALSVGPYMLEAWEKGKTIVFKRNENWNEPGRYNIQGVKLIVIDASSDADAIYKQFNAGNLDSCGIPTKHIAEEMGKPRVYKTRGDATFKLNVNSCTQETWNELFGPSGKINKGSNWDVKPWMSNDNFLKGLYYAIDRKTFAENRGVNPSINYFADSYLNDPENGKSYNDSEAHKEAIHSYETKDSNGNSTYGYSRDKAILAFSNAVNELAREGKLIKGTKNNPKVINIHIKWMYQTDVKEYGEEIKGYFESAFNDNAVSQGTVKLEVTQDAVTNWQDVYNEYLMKGQFDLGFGAISGNTYNPLNFLEVLKSDNSSGFTLNWGTDTSKMTTNKPLIYEDKMWSFDSLWAVADHGGVVNNGEIAKTVEKCFLVASRNDFYNGGFNFQVATKFIDVESAKLEITRIQIYVFGYGGIDVSFTLAED